MATPPDKKTKAQKDPAKPTRAKAHRPDVQPIGPALAELLNSAIGKGEAGIGSGTGQQHRSAFDQATEARSPSPTPLTEARSPSPAPAARPLPNGERLDE